MYQELNMNRMLKKYLKAFLYLFGLGIASLALAQSGNYPNRPIKIVIPFPHGNTTDII